MRLSARRLMVDRRVDSVMQYRPRADALKEWVSTATPVIGQHLLSLLRSQYDMQAELVPPATACRAPR